MTLQLVLFDIDGTLLDGHGIGRASTHRALLEHFGRAGRLDTHSFGGKTDWGTLCEILDLSEAEIGRHMPAYERCVERHMRDLLAEFEIVPLPGALQTVHALRAQPGSITGIVTGNTAATTPLKLEAAGFDPAWFPVCAYGSEARTATNCPPSPWSAPWRIAARSSRRSRSQLSATRRRTSPARGRWGRGPWP